MTIGMFNSVYAETIFSLLKLFASGFEGHILKDTGSNAENYDIFIFNKALPKNFALNRLFCETAIVDSDNDKVTRCLKHSSASLVTYGFNSKASLTVSGVTVAEPPFNLKVTFCLRRALRRADGNLILQQEFAVDTCGLDFEKARLQDASEPSFVAQCLLPAVAAAVLMGTN